MEAKIITEARVSIDNGNRWLTADDVEAMSAADFIAWLDGHWGALTSVMDDEPREHVHGRLAPCAEQMFLVDYLGAASTDLVIG